MFWPPEERAPPKNEQGAVKKQAKKGRRHERKTDRQASETKAGAERERRREGEKWRRCCGGMPWL